MSAGEILTIGTIWITIVGYAVGTAVFAQSRNRRSWDVAARWAWTSAGLALVAHIAFAFHFYHGWSHTAAYNDTARQTFEVTGLNWGGGVYVNYALLICWLVDVSWWWLGGLDAYRRRSWSLLVAWHGFLIFIIFNATFIFGSGVVRWAGLIVCVSLCVVWWRAAQNLRFESAQRLRVGSGN
jgi:hypothetical protein